MKTVGGTIKEIRKMKNMRQDQFSLSQPAISSIESSERNVTIDTLTSILLDFDLSLREFEFIRNDYQFSESDKIFFDFTSHKNSIEIAKNREMIDKLGEYIEKYPSNFIPYCIHVITDVYSKISSNDTYDIDSPESVFIWEKLEKRKTWTYQEVFIMSKLFFIFPLDKGFEIVERIEREMKKYINFYKDVHFDLTFYANTGKFYTHKNQLDLAKKYLVRALPLSEMYDKVVVENDVYAYLSIINYLEGNIEAEAEILDCVNRFHAMRKPALAEDLENDWNTFFKGKVLI
ncbi:helix-turn-helix domain-containing protein [Listeria booriae]|uniref:Helix-turn-helix domain-containing protein n=1 Tax=Listeria booriae TaxID=1552123 RepID=A0A841YPP7_9LIST|nr:helix-turn-helix domain-containing protein [Listeria booriae]MBC1402103.1 helix-turn-helix domain-containing protein [Listeria booriae]MBC1617835.1 helix-turn-helix domain-containing protein [Listeria booriae]